MRARTVVLIAVLSLLAAAEHRRAQAQETEESAAERAPAALVKRYPFLGEKPVADKPLKERLKKTRTYVVQPGDTLRRIAHLLYGHKTWWKKVKAENKHFLSYRPDDILPPGKIISYGAPKIGKEYVVEPGDWLIRIAQWKYGKTAFWEELYRKNKDRIRDPDLIHPGDRLRFRKDGTIRIAGTDKVVMSGVKSRKSETIEPASTDELEEFEFVGREEPADAQTPADSLNHAPLTADPWRDDKPAGTELAGDGKGRGPSSDEELAEPWWSTWPARGMFLFLLIALIWAGFSYARSSDLILYPKRDFRGYAFDRKPPKPTRGPYDDLSLDEDFLDESNVDRIDIRPRPNYQSLWRVWLRKKLKRLGKNGNS